MENESITKLLIDIHDDLLAFCKFSEMLPYEDLWNGLGPKLFYCLDKEDNQTLFLDYLRSEYHAGHRIDPLIERLRNRLICALEIQPDKSVPVKLRTNFTMLRSKFTAWINSIDLYFPREQTVEKDRELTKTQGEAPKRKTAAAKKLASQELQDVRRNLIDAGLIENGLFMGGPALFKELVYNLHAQWGIENRGGYAWKDCAHWAGYPDDKNSIKSAQNAGIINPGNALGDKAEAIRRICLKPTK